MGASMAGDALPDNIFVSQQFLFHSQTDQINPVSGIEIRVDRIHCAGIGTGTALPAPMDKAAPWESGNLGFEILVIVINDSRFNKGAP